MHEKKYTNSEIVIPKHLISLAKILDDLFIVPGTKIRLGLDGIIGLIPGIGDLLTTTFSLYFIYSAALMGVPISILFKMIGNVTIDACIGAIPVLGDIFDISWRANRKNLNLIKNLSSNSLRPRNKQQVVFYLRVLTIIFISILSAFIFFIFRFAWQLISSL